MGKAPAFQFYPGDWRRDTQVQMLSMAARGVWFEMLCCMWDAPERGKLEGTHLQIARLLGCEEGELSAALSEISVTKTGDVTVCNDYVTVINRRMHREEKERKSTRLRVRRHRVTGENEKCNGDVTAPSSSSSSSSNKSYTETPTPEVTPSAQPITSPAAPEDKKPGNGTGQTTIHPEIKPLCEKIMITFPGIPVLTFLGNHTRHNQEAVVDSMKALLKHHETVEPVKAPMKYLEAAMQMKNGSYNARDHDRESQKFNEPVTRGEMKTITEIFRKAGAKG